MRLLVLGSFCLFAAFGLSCAVATPSAFAKQKPHVVEKKTSGVSSGKRRASAATRSKKKDDAPAARRGKPVVVASRETATNPEPRTPTDKQDCIAVAQNFYNRAGTLARQSKQPIPPAFVRVVSKLDEFCGEEDFDKARTSIDWMNMCLQDLAGGQKNAACSNSESQVCAADPQSNACSTDKRLAGY